MTILYVRSGTEYRPTTSVEVLETAATIEAREFETSRTYIGDPSTVQQFLTGQLQHCEHEFFCVLYLDARNCVIAFEKMFRGTVDGAAVHPREVVKAALGRNAAAVIFAHNHPSGVAQPSMADEHITKQLRVALAQVDIRVLDHVIVGDGCYSFAAHGLM